MSFAGISIWFLSLSLADSRCLTVEIWGLPTVIGDIIEKMTARRPEDRCQDLDEVVHDIELFLELRQDTSKARIIHSRNDRGDSEITDSSASSKPASVQSPVDGEVGGQLELASKRFRYTLSVKRSTIPARIAQRLSPTTSLPLFVFFPADRSCEFH